MYQDNQNDPDSFLVASIEYVPEFRICYTHGCDDLKAYR